MALTTDQRERLQDLQAFSADFMRHWWDYQAMLTQWNASGGLASTITQQNLTDAGISADVNELKDVVYWFTNSVLGTVDNTLAQKINRMGHELS